MTQILVSAELAERLRTVLGPFELVDASGTVLVSWPPSGNGPPQPPTNGSATLVAQRQRAAALLRDQVRILEAHEGEARFSALTLPLLEGIRALLGQLAETPTEGHTREILRRLRDSFLSGGWERYRATPCRAALTEVLTLLATDETIGPSHLAQTRQLLARLRLDELPVQALPPADEDARDSLSG